MHLLLLLSVFLPLPFWVIESSYRKYHKGWQARLRAIRDFIRDGKYKVKGQEPQAILADFLTDVYDTHDFGGKTFPVFDYWGTETLEPEKHKRETDFLRNFFARRNLLLYPLMMGFSLLSLYDLSS